MYVLKQPVTELSHFQNPFRSQKSALFASKTGSYTRRFAFKQNSPKYQCFPTHCTYKIAKIKTYHEPSNTMASDVKIMNTV